MRYLFFFIIIFITAYFIFETNLVKPLLYAILMTIVVIILNFLEKKKNK